MKKCGKINIICLAKQAIIWPVLFFKEIFSAPSQPQPRATNLKSRTSTKEQHDKTTHECTNL